MARALQAPTVIRIILPEDSCETKPTQPSAIRHCGQTVEGDLEVTTEGKFAFEIDLSFEGCYEILCSPCSPLTKDRLGLVRTWLGYNSNNDSSSLQNAAEVQASRLSPFLS